MDVIDARTAVQGDEPEATSNVINLLDVKVWKVSACVRESLQRIQGFMAFRGADGGDSA